MVLCVSRLGIFERKLILWQFISEEIWHFFMWVLVSIRIVSRQGATVLDAGVCLCDHLLFCSWVLAKERKIRITLKHLQHLTQLAKIDDL